MSARIEKLVVTLVVHCASYSEEELRECGLEEEDVAEEAAFVPSDTLPDDVATLIAGALESEEVIAELFAGSAIFMNFRAVEVRDAKWEGRA